LKQHFSILRRCYYETGTVVKLIVILYLMSFADIAFGQTPGTQKWSSSTGGTIYYVSPAIGSDGTVYIGSYSGKLYAVNPNGSLKWTFTTGGPIYYSSPAIGSDGTIYVGSQDNNLYAVNPMARGSGPLRLQVMSTVLRRSGMMEPSMSGRTTTNCTLSTRIAP